MCDCIAKLNATLALSDPGYRVAELGCDTIPIDVVWDWEPGVPEPLPRAPERTRCISATFCPNCGERY